MVDEIGIEGKSVEELLTIVAQRAPGELVERAGGLERLSRAESFEIAAHLERRDPDSTARAARRAPKRTTLRTARVVAAAFELGRRVEAARARLPESIASAGDVAKWASPRLAQLTHEELWLLALDGRGCLRSARCVAKGGLHGASVRVADPLRAALRLDASAFVLVHNHPSGDPTPSKEDLHLTQQLARAAELVGLVLLDHVIVSRTGYSCVSIAPASGDKR